MSKVSKHRHQIKSVHYTKKCGNSNICTNTTVKQSYGVENDKYYPYDGKPFLKLFFIKDNYEPFAPFTLIAKDIARIISKVRKREQPNANRTSQ